MKYRKHIRLSPELYTEPGWYFITLVSRRKQNLFTGQIKVLLEDVLKDIPKIFSGWEIDSFIIMPNHLHFILSATDCSCRACPCSLGRVVGAYKSLVYKRLRQEMGMKESPWQLNYYEHIVRSEKELDKIRLYIKANPFKEAIDWKEMDSYMI